MSYGELCQVTLGTFSYFFLVTITFLMSFLCICVYNILFRTQIKDIISDINSETFVYDKYVLLGVSLVLILPFCLLRDISKLSYVSLVSSVSVVIIVLITIARSPFYHREMVNLDYSEMRINEVKLNTERSLYLCDSANKEPDKYLVGHVKNYSYLLQALLDKNACPKLPKNEQIDEIISNLPELPQCYSVNNCDTWIEAIAHSHSNYLLSIYSLQVTPPESNSALLFLSSLGIYASTFICQQTTFSIFRQMKTQTVRQWKIVQLVSFSLVYILCMSLALSGYFSQQFQAGDTVFDKMKIRFFVQDDQRDIAVNVARILLVLTIAFSFPLQNFFARKNLLLLYYGLLEKIKKRSFKEEANRPSNVIFYSFSLGQFALALIFGLFVNGLIEVYSLIGALFASPMIYILPCLCYMAVNNNILKFLKENFSTHRTKTIIVKTFLPIFITIFGIVITIISTVSAVWSFFI
ncbi:hypothetical protein MHBO_000944 [Bonamia ostreae]|uniref:Amino acid transporter transmembrane domain-containing protein n=1 Tax=Bonamia ostreae TaxID=126728 RepID=A0ABV2AHD4_9EUKA